MQEGMQYQQQEKVLVTAQEVAALLGISVSMAYKVIRGYNTELAKMGKLTIRGKINRKYLLKKLEV